MKQIYLDTKSKVKFNIKKHDELYKTIPLNLIELGLTGFDGFITIDEFNKLVDKKIIVKCTNK